MSGFLEEVKEQAAALRAVVEAYRGKEGHLLLEARRAIGSRPVLFAGMGSSWAASIAAETFLVGQGRPAVAADCAEALYRWLPILGTSGFAPVLISQSGESREVVGLASKLHGPFLAITNDPSSTLGRAATVALPMHAGREAGVTSKTYTNTVAVCLLLAHALCGKETPAGTGAGTGDVLDAAAAIEDPLQRWHDEIEGLLAHLKVGETAGDPLPWEIVGRGSAMALVHQAALVLRELTGRLVAPFHGGFYRHGPVYRITPRTRVIVLGARGEEGDLLERLSQEIVSRGGRVAFIADFEAGIESPQFRKFQVSAVGPCLFPAVAAVPLEILGASDAAARGFDPTVGVPKVTAVE
jgi:glutamine---fructose-6-phosphate transaminase (isomerizing)